MSFTEGDAGDSIAGDPQQADAADGATRPVAVLRPLFQLELQPPAQPVAPGGRSSVQLRIRNEGDAPARYRLSLEGIPPHWANFEPLTPSVAPGARSEQLLLLHPERHPDYPPGEHALILRVEPTHAPQAARELEFPLQLLPGSGFGMALAQGAGSVQLLLHNHGNAPLPLQLGALAPADAAAPRLPAGPLTLAAGEQRSLPLRLSAGARPLLGRRRVLEFTIEAHSLDDAGFVLALPVQLPVVPLLDWRLLLLLLVLPAVLLPALYRSLTVTPVILDFSSNTSSLTRGETLELAWQVQDASLLQLIVNGEVIDLPAAVDQGGYSLATGDREGDLVLELLAHYGDRSVSQALSVRLHDPLVIEDFVASPPTLLRHVRQTLTLDWRVTGARQLRVDGLPAPDGEAPELDAGSGTLAGNVLPVDDALTLTLVAVDGQGLVQEQSLTLPALPATCRVSDSALTLHTEPQTDAATLAQLETGSQVEVDGRDADGAWLRLQTGELAAWGRRAGLECVDFAPEDLRVLQPGRG